MMLKPSHKYITAVESEKMGSLFFRYRPSKCFAKKRLRHSSSTLPELKLAASTGIIKQTLVGAVSVEARTNLCPSIVRVFRSLSKRNLLAPTTRFRVVNAYLLTCRTLQTTKMSKTASPVAVPTHCQGQVSAGRVRENRRLEEIFSNLSNLVFAGVASDLEVANQQGKLIQ
jgi:hypothetical protein